jgi:hypothetical protein
MASRCVRAAHKCSTVRGVKSPTVPSRCVLCRLHSRPRASGYLGGYVAPTPYRRPHRLSRWSLMVCSPSVGRRRGWRRCPADDVRRRRRSARPSPLRPPGPTLHRSRTGRSGSVTESHGFVVEGEAAGVQVAGDGCRGTGGEGHPGRSRPAIGGPGHGRELPNRTGPLKATEELMPERGASASARTRSSSGRRSHTPRPASHGGAAPSAALPSSAEG